jgi:hypothetical protein
MTENFFEQNIEVPKKIDRLPMNLRLPFQKIVFQKMGIENDPDRVFLDGKIISDYIDDIKNVEVRELIKQKKFEEAAIIVLAEITKVEKMSAAA